MPSGERITVGGQANLPIDAHLDLVLMAT